MFFRPAHLFFLILINLVWGFNVVAAKVGVSHFPPLLFTSLRFGLLALILTPFLRLHRDQMGGIMLVALTSGALHFGFLFVGLARVPEVSVVAIAIQLFVPFSTILSMVFLREHVGWRRGGGILLAFTGVAIIGFDPDMFDHVYGLLLVIVGAFSMAVGTTAMKALRNVGVFDLQGWIAWISAPLLLAFSLWFENNQVAALQTGEWLYWGAVLYTALGASLVGHGGTYYLIKRYPVTLIAPFTVLATLFGVTFGILLLGDRLTWRIVVGGALTVAGVYVIARLQETRRPVSET